MFYYCGRIVGVDVDVEGSLLGFLYGGFVPSVRFRVTSTKLQIFRFVLKEMFSPVC